MPSIKAPALKQTTTLLVAVKCRPLSEKERQRNHEIVRVTDAGDVIVLDPDLSKNYLGFWILYRTVQKRRDIVLILHLGLNVETWCSLTGKYTPENPPSGPRSQIYTPDFLTRLQPLLNRITEIGQNYSKTPTQVVLNWLIAQENVIPIPGAKNAEQAREFAGALGWRLTDEEIAELRSLASEIRPVVGFPVEYL